MAAGGNNTTVTHIIPLLLFICTTHTLSLSHSPPLSLTGPLRVFPLSLYNQLAEHMSAVTAIYSTPSLYVVVKNW